MILAMTNKETKEVREKAYAGEFLRLKGVSFSNLQSASEYLQGCEKKNVAGPDVKVTISDDFGARRIGIELTWYSSDADKKKGSVAIQRERVRRRLREELVSYLSVFPELDKFQIRVRFWGGEEKLPGDGYRRMAGETAALLGPKLAYVRGHCSFDPILRPSVFKGYPNLQKYTKCIDISRNTGNHRGTFGWFNAGDDWEWVGIEPEQVCYLVHEHHPSKYDLGDVNNECWLVIYSTGLGGSVGWTEGMEKSSLSSPHIAEAVARSGYDRVYFWCREFNWTALLEPVGTSEYSGFATVG